MANPKFKAGDRVRVASGSPLSVTVGFQHATGTIVDFCGDEGILIWNVKLDIPFPVPNGVSISELPINEDSLELIP